MSDHACCLQGLAGVKAIRHGLQGRVEFLDAIDRADLGKLGSDLGIVERIQGVLVLHLRDQQLEKAVLRIVRRLLGRIFCVI